MSPKLASLLKELQKPRAIKRGKQSLVVLTIEQWREILDVLTELGSPKLAKSIVAGRKAYKEGRALSYSKLRRVLGLS